MNDHSSTPPAPLLLCGVLLGLLLSIGCGELAGDFQGVDNKDEAEPLESSQRSLKKGQPRATNGDTDYCGDPANQCVSGEGDCDNDAECEGSLVCGKDNGPNFGLPPRFDVCVAPSCANGVQDAGENGVDCGGECGTCAAVNPRTPGSSAYCDNPNFPCAAQQGDCDSDAQCQAGLSCISNVGASFGMPANYDVCLASHCKDGTQNADETGVDCGGSCGACPNVRPGVSGSASYCSGVGPLCTTGQGDCDSDSECASGLVCGSDNGPQFALPAKYDVCVPGSCVNGVQDAGESGVDCGGECGTCAASAASVVSISSGERHTCALLSDGTAKCWGFNGAGQLGDGTTSSSNTPVAVMNITNATSISVGDLHTCASLTDGTAKCWGNNNNGLLGDGTRTPSITPVPVTDLTDVASVSVGGQHTCALLNNGTAKCWGVNGAGQLGDGTRSPRLIPVTVMTLANVASISSGKSHTCAVLTDATAKCWGDNSDGGLGNGTTSDSATPVTVMNLSNVASISSGDRYTCVALTDLTAKCWGRNRFGALGDGTSSSTTTPVSVMNLSTVEFISSGANHTCAALTDGTAKCWGFNRLGQSGNGTITNSNTPVSVTNLSDAEVVSSGRNHTCASLTDGTVACWGSNERGQLGDGTTTDRTTPVTVQGL